MGCRYKTWHYTSGIFGVVTQHTTASDFGGVRSRTRTQAIHSLSMEYDERLSRRWLHFTLENYGKTGERNWGDGREHKRNNGDNGNYVYTVF